MKVKAACCIFLWMCLLLRPCYSWSQVHSDSLRKALSFTSLDTEKIKLRCLLGAESKIMRTSYWDSIVSDARAHKLFLYECKALAGLSSAYKNQNNIVRATEVLKRSLSLAEEKGYKPEVILLIKEFRNLDQGNGKNLLDLYYKGLEVAEELQDKRSVVDFYSFIAMHYFFMEDLNKALEMHFNCLRIYKELGYHAGIADALVDIGSDYHALGNIKKTFEYYLASGKYADEFRESIYGAYINNAVGAGYELTGELDSAYKYSSRSYHIAQQMNNKSCMISASVVLAKVLFKKGDNRGAEKKALECIALSRAIGFTVQLPDLELFLKKVYLKDKNYKKALEAYELYVATKDSISNEKNRKQALQKEFAYNFEKKKNENRLLAQRYQIQSLQLNKNKYILSGLAGLVFILAISGYLFLRQNRIKSEQQSLELEQKLLRSQMNPHFIFNSLNSIQQFIISGNNNLAEVYLSKFSKLVRELLESNTRESISVKEEADILQGYMDMESLRFRKSFSFSVTIDEKINQQQEHIPHMMIQPFVENAIWHGLLPKKGERSLTIRFETLTSKTLKCIVEDNGVGRANTAEKEATFKKKSLGLNFINQRIRLMRKTLKVDCSVEITDKTNGEGENMGTRVVIVLPLISKSC